MKDQQLLAIAGGLPVRNTPFPARHLLGQEEKDAVVSLLDEAILTGEAIGYSGKYEKQYTEEFCRFMGGGFADGVNSGTNALFIALGALGLDALSEVIVPPISDPGGVMPVLFAGCVPVMADSDPHSYNSNAEEIERVITDRTRAIIVAHILGEPADMDPILDLAQRKNLYVIEDCAQAHGARYKQRLVGTMGHIAAFSTMYSKLHCTGPQGGVVFTKDENLFWQAQRFADRGKPFNLSTKDNVVAGLNCNMNEMAAAIGLPQVRKLPNIIAGRRRVAQMICEGLEDCCAVRPGWVVPDADPVYWFLRLALDLSVITVTKQQFCDAVQKEGIPIFAFFRYIPCEMEWFREKAVFGKTGFPWNCSDYRGERNPQFKTTNVNHVAETHFNIAIHEGYSEDDINDIIVALRKVENAYRQ